MTTILKPIIYDSEAFAEAIEKIRQIAERKIPGERGFARYYASDAAHDTRECRKVLQLLNQTD